MTSDRQPRAAELFKKLRNCTGERIYWKREVLKASYYIFSRNYEELQQTIRHFEAPENLTKYWGVQNESESTAFQREHMRLLHNFLAAAFTLVDHTRIVARELYCGVAFHQEYQERIAGDFGAFEIARFMKGLRNWMVHRGLLPICLRTAALSPDKIEATIILDVGELKKWGDWDTLSRKYLDNAPSHLLLRNVVTLYHDRVQEFYHWLQRRMDELHAKDMEEWASLQRELRAL